MIAIVAIAALVVMTNIKAVEQEAQEIIGAIDTNTWVTELTWITIEEEIGEIIQTLEPTDYELEKSAKNLVN